MKSRSIKGGSPEEIKIAWEHSMADGFKPTLAIVFLSIKQNRNACPEAYDIFKRFAKLFEQTYTRSSPQNLQGREPDWV